MNLITPQRKQELYDQFIRIENQLSPENLSMDGEASPEYVRLRYHELIHKRIKVIQELGGEPTSKELYGFSA